MSPFATNIAMKLHAIATAVSGALLGSLHQPFTGPLAARRRVDTQIADSAEVAFERQLDDEVQGNEAEQLPLTSFGYQQAGIGMIQVLLKATLDDVIVCRVAKLAEQAGYC
jgi:hypothetical protein